MRNYEAEYMCYVAGWIHDHLTREQFVQAALAYAEDQHPCTDFFHWVVEEGVNGMAPACFSEWLSMEANND